MQSANEVALRDVPFVVAEEALLAAASVVLEPRGWRVPFEKVGERKSLRGYSRRPREL